MATHYCSRCLTTFQGTPERCPNLSCGKGPPREGWGSVLGEGDLLDRHYLIDKVLAIGGAGLTYLAREVDEQGGPTGPQLAIKVLYTQRDAGPFLRRLSNEAQILQDLDHPHIVKCRGFVHRTGKAPYLVTLFEEGGALTDFVEAAGGLPPRVAAGVLKQILLALDMAHQRGVVHRDLKPDNVLLHQRVEPSETPLVRVADFGIAKVFGGVGDRLTRLGSFIGTPEYAAPEQFEGVTPTPATDVFAAGGVLYYLITGEPPLRFSHRHDIAASHEELLAQLPPQLPTAGSDSMTLGALQEIINWTMTLRPGDRWTVQQILSRLNAVIEGKPAQAYTDQGAPTRMAAPPTSTFVPQRTDEVSRRTLERADGKTLSEAATPTNSDHGDPRPPREAWADQAEAPPVPSKPSGKAPDTWRVDKEELEEAAASLALPPPPEEPPPPPAASEPPPPPPEEPPPPPSQPPGPPDLPPPPVGNLVPPPPVHSPAPPPVREAPARGGRGKGLLAAGGAMFMLGGGALLLVIALLVVWQLGLLGGGGTVELADPAHRAERDAVQAALDRSGADIAKLCGASGEISVALTLAPSGQVTSAAVDPSSAPADKLECLTDAFARLSLPRSSGGEARLRAAVALK